MLVTKNEVETASYRLEIELSCYAQKPMFALSVLDSLRTQTYFRLSLASAEKYHLRSQANYRTEELACNGGSCEGILKID